MTVSSCKRRPASINVPCRLVPVHAEAYGLAILKSLYNSSRPSGHMALDVVEGTSCSQFDELAPANSQPQAVALARVALSD